MVATASRDQTVRLFDIRAMKEFKVLRGHKKEVCCALLSVSTNSHMLTGSLALAWHPVHPILVSGGSEGSILYWDINAPESTPSVTHTTQTIGPRATLAEAHDSNVWSLAFHPLGHLLVSASNDHTTRFWARERPGDAGSIFSGGGARPPAGAEEDVDDAEGEDEEQSMIVPGLMSMAGGIPGIGGGMGFNHAQDHTEQGRTDSPFRRERDGAGTIASGMGGGAPGLGISTAEDGFPGIPGFGRPADEGRAQNYRQDAPPREDWYGDVDDRGGRWTGSEGYRDRERDRSYGGGSGRGGGGRSGRWGPRRGGGRY